MASAQLPSALAFSSRPAPSHGPRAVEGSAEERSLSWDSRWRTYSAFPIVWPEVGAWEGKLVELFHKYVGLFGKRKGKRKR